MKGFTLNARFWMGTLAAVSLGAVPLWAAAKASYDLYSWKKSGASYWCYHLGPTSDQPAVAADLQASKESICGRDSLKSQIMNLPKDAVVEWKIVPDQGLVLPPADSVRSVERFAMHADHKMILPKTPPPVANQVDTK